MADGAVEGDSRMRGPVGEPMAEVVRVDGSLRVEGQGERGVGHLGRDELEDPGLERA